MFDALLDTVLTGAVALQAGQLAKEKSMPRRVCVITSHKGAERVPILMHFLQRVGSAACVHVCWL